MEPNTLIVKYLDKGFIEAFANIYKNFALSLLEIKKGKQPNALMSDYPTIADGVRGMRFIDKVIESAESDKKWINFN